MATKCWRVRASDSARRTVCRKFGRIREHCVSCANIQLRVRDTENARARVLIFSTYTHTHKLKTCVRSQRLGAWASIAWPYTNKYIYILVYIRAYEVMLREAGTRARRGHARVENIVSKRFPVQMTQRLPAAAARAAKVTHFKLSDIVRNGALALSWLGRTRTRTL